jgi:hypothetical protein
MSRAARTPIGNAQEELSACSIASGANLMDWLFLPGICRVFEPYVSICKYRRPFSSWMLE